ncbi:formate dehydrogenase accessory protein FdhE [Solidesulfovibrio aerotolerans]|uniref:formate dehydrogenase accessory protein FdhE n=1 Tax=Solidesulfovibrio aerotolerans TaxID=295255 RepID=UPI001BA95AF5|nr:formate dehydrogenase accessory protein FdhE [Solidesulfovibrio aerotolerans]
MAGLVDSDVALADDIERLRRERPHVRAFLDPFMGLLLARRPLVDALVLAGPPLPLPQADPARLGQGACLEPRDEFPLDRVALRRSFETLHLVVAAAFRNNRADLLNLSQVADQEPEFLSEAVGHLLADRRSALVGLGHSCGVDPRVLGFWCVQLITPLAMARGRQIGGLVAGLAWNRGYCPVCGSWPGYAVRDGDGLEMTCSFCAASWRFTRHECPYCEAPGPSGQVYVVPGQEAERVRVCRRCNHFLGEFAAESLPGLTSEVAALALAPLELLARQHGHAPATMDWRQMVWT